DCESAACIWVFARVWLKHCADAHLILSKFQRRAEVFSAECFPAVECSTDRGHPQRMFSNPWRQIGNRINPFVAGIPNIRVSLNSNRAYVFRRNSIVGPIQISERRRPKPKAEPTM